MAPGVRGVRGQSNLISSHVVRHVDGVQLVSQEPVPEVHPLFLTPGIDWHGARICDDDDADDEVALLQNRVGDQRHQIQGLVFGSVQLGDDD